MVSYSKAAMERAMKVQEVILRPMANKITWWGFLLRFLFFTLLSNSSAEKARPFNGHSSTPRIWFNLL